MGVVTYCGWVAGLEKRVANVDGALEATLLLEFCFLRTVLGFDVSLVGAAGCKDHSIGASSCLCLRAGATGAPGAAAWAAGAAMTRVNAATAAEALPSGPFGLAPFV